MRGRVEKIGRVGHLKQVDTSTRKQARYRAKTLGELVANQLSARLVRSAPPPHTLRITIEVSANSRTQREPPREQNTEGILELLIGGASIGLGNWC
jgi:hypothetical protein